MKRCVTCNSVYGDDEQFCEKDGGLLLDIAILAPSPTARRIRSALKTVAPVAAAAFLIGAAGLLAFFVINRQPAQPQTGKMEGQHAVGVNNQGAPRPPVAAPRPSPATPSDWLRELLRPPATPSPTPPPEITPAPTAAPTPEAPDRPAGQVEEPKPPQSGGESSAHSSTMTVISFRDGTSLEVDDVWRDEQGVIWYSRGGQMARIGGRRIKAITRPPVAERTPTPAPTPSPAPQQTPGSTPTPTPELLNR